MKIPRLLRSLIFGLIAILSTVSFFSLPVHAANPAPVTVDNNQNLSGWHITSSPAGIDCTDNTGTCTYTFNQGDVVVLTATPPPGRSVYDWSGIGCQEGSGSAHLSNTCTVTANCMCTNDVHIYFGWPTYTVQTAVEGTGKGTVTSSPAGLNCPGACSASFANSANITLTATPAAGSVFAGWGTANDPGGANACFNGGGIGPDMTRGTSVTCTFPADGLIPTEEQSAMSGVAFFDSTGSPASTPPSTSTSSTKSSTTQSTTTPAATAAPTAANAAGAAPNLSLDGIKVSGGNGTVKVNADTVKTVVLPLATPLVLSGKTVPNGIVNLTIHSTLRTASVTADANGNWTYTVTGLEAGQHHVDATVTDPVTKQTSSSVTLAAFTVAAKSAPNAIATVAASKSKQSSMLPVAVASVIVLVLIAGAVFWWLKRRKSAVRPIQ